MKLRHLALAAALAVGVAAPTLRAQLNLCADCRTARIWSTTVGTFPETGALTIRRPGAIDFGVAFSGGGTRSASATTGQLRGLAQNGWLEKARYITAVSGGAWAAIPYTYTEATDEELLGPLTPPDALRLEPLTKCPDGRMAASIGAGQLPAASFKEAAWRVSSEALQKDSERFIRQGLSWLLSRREGDRGEKTYARFIGDVFIDPIVDPVDKQASRRLFGWDDTSVDEAVRDNPGKLSHIDFLTSDARRRPFLIVGGTVVSTRDIYSYPLLMPIEYTQLYTGIRHRFGEKYGGTYVSSWAYDHVPAGPVSGRSLQVHQGDVAASAGAAPQLAVLLGERYEALPTWARSASGAAADFFPSYTPAAVHDDGGVFVSAPTPHGDGGFTDNFGLMPLLARGVKNIIVFANTPNEYDKNDDLASYFEAVSNPGPTGNKSLNRVFEPGGYDALKAQFRDDKLAGRPLVHCTTKDRPWKVLENAFYEIKPYDGLQICWVYNHAVDAWSRQISDAGVQKLLAGKDFQSFPWYDTFKQLKLNIAHVNLLADLTGWVVTDAEVIRRIRGAMPDLPEPRRPVPAATQFIAGRCVAPAAVQPR